MMRGIAVAGLVLLAVQASAAPSAAVIDAECRALPASGTFSLPTTQPLAAGDTLLVAVGADSHQLDGTRVQLGSQPFARATTGVRSPRNRDTIVLFLHRLVGPAPVGTALMLRFDATSATAPVCTQAIRLPALDTPYRIAGQRQSQSIAGTAAISTVDDLLDAGRVVMATWFSATALPVTSNAVVLGTACGPGGMPCLVLVEQENVTSPVSTTVTPSAPQPWSATLLAVDDPRLFRDGFE